MKSTPWLASLGVLGVALALAVPGCTKDNKSTEPTDKTPVTNKQVQPEGSRTNAVPPQLGNGAGAARLTPNRAPKVAITPDAPGGDASYQVRLDAPSALGTGAEGVVRVFVEPKTGWKMNHEFPTRLQIISPEGVSLDKDKQVVEDAERFEDAGATFAVKFKVDSPGDKAFHANFRFAVCTDATCDPKKEELAWSIKVQ